MSSNLSGYSAARIAMPTVAAAIPAGRCPLMSSSAPAAKLPMTSPFLQFGMYVLRRKVRATRARLCCFAGQFIETESNQRVKPVDEVSTRKDRGEDVDCARGRESRTGAGRSG